MDIYFNRASNVAVIGSLYFTVAEFEGMIGGLNCDVINTAGIYTADGAGQHSHKPLTAGFKKKLAGLKEHALYVERVAAYVVKHGHGPDVEVAPKGPAEVWRDVIAHAEADEILGVLLLAENVEEKRRILTAYGIFLSRVLE